MKTKINSNKTLIFCLILFYIFSIISIYSFSEFITNDIFYYIKRQTIFYIIGSVFIFLALKNKLKFLIKYHKLFYFISVLLLLLVLLFAKEVNGIKAWFQIPYLGSFQPSEFMKISLILTFASLINDYHNKNFSLKNEIILILKMVVLTIIPAILTFLEPDTGAVLIYLIILFIMLFASGIRIRWFILFFIVILVILGTIFYLFYYKEDLFIKLFGSSLFYRFDRLFDWQASSGMQLENSLIVIASSSILGNKIASIPLYYPEGHTDFIFTSFIACFGLIGAIVLIGTIIIFDLTLFNKIKNNNDITTKMILIGTLGALIYQQFQNIAMTIGILPITGITLPFISYGGSSLISYFLLISICIQKEKISTLK